MQDYYETLGVKRDATDAEIKKAYRRLALEWHPDRNKSPEASDRFKKINEAFEVLSDPQKRRNYDQFGHAGVKHGTRPDGAQQGPFSYTYQGGNLNDFFDSFGMGGGGFSDPFDIFESFFGFRTPRSRPQKAIYQVGISFEEAVQGAEKRFVIKGQTRTIKIPAGVDSGTRIRFSEFDILIEVAPSRLFHREGQDLYYEQRVSYFDAILGTAITVPALAKNIKVKIKPGTQPNTVIRLKNFGIPYPNSHRIGDLYIVIKVTLPERVRDQEKQYLEAIRKQEQTWQQPLNNARCMYA